MQNAAFCSSSAAGNLLGSSNPNKTNGGFRRRSCRMCARRPRREMNRRDALTAFAAAASAVVAGLHSRPPTVEAAMYSSDTNGTEFLPKGDLTKIEAYLPQIRGGYQVLLDLDKNWVSTTSNYDGDTVRRILGTVGVTSPLFNIRKTFLKSWQLAANSAIEQETLEEMDSDWNLVLDGIASVDSQMYSVSFTELESTKDSLITNAKIALGDTIDSYDRFLKNLEKAL